MRFEKLNENKIRITLNHEDLIKNDIDFHSFMSNSLESQELFLNMLKEAERKVGFSTQDYLVKIEALALAGGDFILTITRTSPYKPKDVPKNYTLDDYIKKKYNRKTSNKKNKLHIKNKIININDSIQCIMHAIYRFNTFDEYCTFAAFCKNNFTSTSFAKKILLYKYNKSYFLVLSHINLSTSGLKIFLSAIVEYADFISSSEVLQTKLEESGRLIMKHNALAMCIKHFV